ncbi:hypothetical protein GALL_112020 [mine drainage metagenome]|uniref:Uncharacterized protein n=1 Tax=mine drainage metagenome TaxID=410659 RepID=A0A1J5SYB5_9ZZZZ
MAIKNLVEILSQVWFIVSVSVYRLKFIKEILLKLPYFPEW